MALAVAYNNKTQPDQQFISQTGFDNLRTALKNHIRVWAPHLTSGLQVLNDKTHLFIKGSLAQVANDMNDPRKQRKRLEKAAAELARLRELYSKTLYEARETVNRKIERLDVKIDGFEATQNSIFASKEEKRAASFGKRAYERLKAKYIDFRDRRLNRYIHNAENNPETLNAKTMMSNTEDIQSEFAALEQQEQHIARSYRDKLSAMFTRRSNPPEAQNNNQPHDPRYENLFDEEDDTPAKKKKVKRSYSDLGNMFSGASTKTAENDNAGSHAKGEPDAEPSDKPESPDDPEVT